ncbi:MAG TPA: nucleoside triphosphate pyrophosphohydrolase [Crocinitomix sp.]|nr:nucleoside triphosphate pyrophosphohydrolase [Crocinitomix sp.]
MEEKLKAFERLLNIMEDLRAKCPWDKKQTLESLRHLTIEETYELADAIIEKDMQEIKGELGDLMLHLVFYSKIASETNDFDIADVLNTVCDKLVRRHPHIYGNTVAQTEEEVKANWEKIKLSEKNTKTNKVKQSVLEGVPKSLPALVKASRIQEKVKGLGFEWDNKQQVWDKVLEEIEELKQAEEKGNQNNVEEEFGDVLFALINYARWINVNPENALEKTNKKFIKRFQWMEKQTKIDGKNLSQMNLDDMNHYWEQAKNYFKH